MKKTIILMALSLLVLGACKKDKPKVKTFADYTFNDIKAEDANINSDIITYNAPNTNFKVGSIIFFKTSSGNYGKMQVVSVDANQKLTVNLVVYDAGANGTLIYNKNNFQIDAVITNGYDLDLETTPEVGQSNPNTADFVWGTSGQYLSMVFVAQNNAEGMLFKL